MRRSHDDVAGLSLLAVVSVACELYATGASRGTMSAVVEWSTLCGRGPGVEPLPRRQLAASFKVNPLFLLGERGRCPLGKA